MAGKRTQYETKFVKDFKKYLEDKKKLKNVHAGCRSKNRADVEFTDAKERCWILEAKTHISNNEKDNAVHKIFGELLKETGRKREAGKDYKYGILIEGMSDGKESGFEFFQRSFKEIDEKAFKGFGKLFGELTVFVFDSSKEKLSFYEWDKFYNCEESETIQKF